MNQLVSRTIDCPYCGESIDILIDCSISQQNYIEDCQVCCRPINLVVEVDHDDGLFISAKHENE